MVNLTRFVAVSAGTAHERVLDLPVPDAIYVVHEDMTGQEFLHLPMVLPCDKGHDWNVRDGKVRLSGPITENYWLVLRYGPALTCCDAVLRIGTRFCPMCGKATRSTVEAL